jgi:hypothetical protein
VYELFKLSEEEIAIEQGNKIFLEFITLH